MRRGFAVSINTLVVVILGIVILLSGLVIIEGIMGTAKEIIKEADAETKKEVNELLVSGQLLAIPNPNPTGNYDTYFFVMGFSNRLTTTQTFVPEVIPIDIVSPDGQIYDASTMPIPFMVDYATDPIELRAGEKRADIPFSISVLSGPKGTYTYKAVIALPGSADNYAEKLIRITIK